MTAPVTLEAKQAEKGRLALRARAVARAEYRAQCEREPLLKTFRRDFGRASSPLLFLADHPLRAAPMDVRRAVLRQIDRHAAKVRRRMGLAILDDPLPPQTNVFFIARELLAVR